MVTRYFGMTSDLITVAGELAARHLYLDPHSPAPDTAARSYCALCLRYGLNARAIDHAESCLVGRTIRILADLEVFFRGEAARFEAKLAGLPQPVEAVDDDARRRIEYFTGDRRNFNPYTHPCPAMRGNWNCELEAEHTGPHRAGGGSWAAGEESES